MRNSNAKSFAGQIAKICRGRFHRQGASIFNPPSHIWRGKYWELTQSFAANQNASNLSAFPDSGSFDFTEKCT